MVVFRVHTLPTTCFTSSVWFEMSTKRLITVVNVSLSSAGAWRRGNIPAVATGGGGGGQRYRCLC